jgi:hypothetical protein
MFEMAESSLLDWSRRMKLGSRVRPAELVTKFRMAREAMRFVLSENAYAVCE